jgi:hypothetical protein
MGYLVNNIEVNLERTLFSTVILGLALGVLQVLFDG